MSRFLPSMERLHGLDIFFASLILFVIFPLLPLVLDYIIDGLIKPDPITITAVMFPISVGIASRTHSMFFSGTAITLGAGIIYGITRATGAPIELKGLGITSEDISRIVLTLSVIGLIIERFIRHVI